jgi:hypothetical protein
MHALIVRVTIRNADRTWELLNSQVVPQVSGARRVSRLATGRGRRAAGV